MSGALPAGAPRRSRPVGRPVVLAVSWHTSGVLLAWRWSGLLVVAGWLLLSSCGDDSLTTAGPDVSGDGRIDCSEGQVTQGAAIEVFADSEDDVVALALEQWTSQGATLVALPSDESWAAVLDGRDVAIAYPERNGNGRWTVHAVSRCGAPRNGAAPVDRRLDCVNDVSWGQQGVVDPTIPGLPTADGALMAALEPFLEQHGGTIVSTDEHHASIVINDREQVWARVIEVEAGGWVATTFAGCEGFER